MPWWQRLIYRGIKYVVVIQVCIRNIFEKCSVSEEKIEKGYDFAIVPSLNAVSAVSAGMPVLILRPSGHILFVVTRRGHVFSITTSCHFVRLVLISYETFGDLLCPHPERPQACAFWSRICESSPRMGRWCSLRSANSEFYMLFCIRVKFYISLQERERDHRLREGCTNFPKI